MKHNYKFIFTIIILVISVFALTNLFGDAKVRNRCIMMDVENNQIILYVDIDTTYQKLKEIHQSKQPMWIGGDIDPFSGSNWNWSYQFDPDSIYVLPNVPDSLKTTLAGIQNNLDHWLKVNKAFVQAKVISVTTDLSKTSWGRIKSFYADRRR